MDLDLELEGKNVMEKLLGDKLRKLSQAKSNQSAMSVLLIQSHDTPLGDVSETKADARAMSANPRFHGIFPNEIFVVETDAPNHGYSARFIAMVHGLKMMNAIRFIGKKM